MSGNSLNISGGSVRGNVVQGSNVGTISYTESSSSQDADDEKLASEIQEILDRLSGTNLTTTIAGRMTVATEAVEYIDQNVSLKRRIINSIKAGGVAAIGQFLNHPAASFVIAAFEDWNSQNKTTSP